MRAGISTACFYPMVVENSLEDLNKHNVKNIEVFLNTISEVKPTFVKEMSKRIKFNQQSIASVHPFTCGFEPFMLFTNYQRRFEDALEWHKYYFEAMNILDAKIFVFHGDRKQSATKNKMYFERFAKLRDLGKSFNVTVAQENVERCKSGSLDFLEEMIRYLDNDVALVFDNKQAIRSNVSASDFINTVGKSIVHMHISDHNETDDCLPIGAGKLDLESLLLQLKSVCFDGSIMVELYSERLSALNEIYESFSSLEQSIDNIHKKSKK